MKRILITAALIGLSTGASHACTEYPRERINANVERLFEQMNANGSSATGQAYMHALQNYGECIAEMRTGNNTPLNGNAYAAASSRYPLANFPNHPLAPSKWHDPKFGAMFDDCETAKQEDPSFDCSVSSEHSERHNGN
jgi:hypothetical protein